MHEQIPVISIHNSRISQAVLVDASDSSIVKSAPADATVVVTVTDVNDNPPRFIDSHYLGTVAESARIGDIAFAGVAAFDLDEVHTIVHYYYNNYITH